MQDHQLEHAWDLLKKWDLMLCWLPILSPEKIRSIGGKKGERERERDYKRTFWRISVFCEWQSSLRLRDLGYKSMHATDLKSKERISMRPHWEPAMYPLDLGVHLGLESDSGIFKERKMTTSYCEIEVKMTLWAAIHRRCRFNPWVGKIPWRRKWQTHSSILAWKIPWTEESGGL